MRRYSALGRIEPRFVSWLLGRWKADLGQFLLARLSGEKKKRLKEALCEAGTDTDDYREALARAINEFSIAEQKKTSKLVRKLNQLTYRGKSEIEKNSRFLQRMFDLERHEIDLVIFLFIMATYDTPNPSR